MSYVIVSRRTRSLVAQFPATRDGHKAAKACAGRINRRAGAGVVIILMPASAVA